VKFDPGNTILDFERIHVEDISKTEREWESGSLRQVNKINKTAEIYKMLSNSVASCPFINFVDKNI
jgi:hypothetical protein